MTEKKTYQDLKAELDETMHALETELEDIDEAIKLYKKGEKILKELENYLEKSKAEIKILKPRK